jgi:hypothetical protein
MCPVGILISSQMQPSASLRRLISPEDRRLKDGLRSVHIFSLTQPSANRLYIHVYKYICAAMCLGAAAAAPDYHTHNSHRATSNKL